MEIIEMSCVKNISLELGDIIKIVDGKAVIYRMVVYIANKYNMIDLNEGRIFNNSYNDGFDTISEMKSNLRSTWPKVYVVKNKDVVINIPDVAFERFV